MIFQKDLKWIRKGKSLDIPWSAKSASFKRNSKKNLQRIGNGLLTKTFKHLWQIKSCKNIGNKKSKLNRLINFNLSPLKVS